jgi:hypothetical protein
MLTTNARIVHAEQSMMRQFDSRPTVVNTPVNTVRTPKLMDRLREALRSRHYSRRTEQTYSLWVRRYIHFHNIRHPAKMAEPEINAFLTPCPSGVFVRAKLVGGHGAGYGNVRRRRTGIPCHYQVTHPSRQDTRPQIPGTCESS